MSFLIKIANSQISFSYNKREYPAPTKLVKDEQHVDIIMGDIYTDKNKILEEHTWYSNPKQLLNVEGLFSVVSIDKIGKKIYFATDKIGTEHIYLYYHNSTFMLSDRFWDIVGELNISYEDLNLDVIKESCIGWFYPENGETIIEGLKIVGVGNFNVFDYSNNKLMSTLYWRFKRNKVKEKDIDNVVKGLDIALNKTFKTIKQKMGEVRYAVGVSGGLDSRIIPYYAKKNGMNIKGFILGCKRPHKIFLSKDHKNARSIVDFFNIKHEEVTWNSDCFEKKVEKEIELAPLEPPQFYKYEPYFDFDCLLTGASGSIIGGDFSKKLGEIQDPDMMVKEIFNLRLPVGWNFVKTKTRRVLTAIKYLFKINLNIKYHEPNWHKKIFNEDMKNLLLNQAKLYVENMYDCGYDNVDIFLNYFIQELTYRNRLGAYESFLGEKRSFSIYMPYVYEEVLNWDEDFFYKRKALKELIKRKIPELSLIGSQNYLLAPGEKNNIFRRMKGIVIAFIRGAGTTTNEIYGKNKFIRKYYTQKMLSSSWYRKVFENLNDSDINELIRDDIKIATYHLKHCVLLKILQTGEYKKYKVCSYEVTEKIE